jgi:cytochrome P450
LATHPEDRKRLVESPELVPNAVEEFLRAYPIVSMARKATQDIDFHGCPIKKDDMVLLSIQSATRDPRQFPDADKVMIDRNPNRHIAFGASEHRCLGSHLARADLQTAILEWHKRIPEYRVPAGEELLGRGGQISLIGLPLEWDV